MKTTFCLAVMLLLFSSTVCTASENPAVGKWDCVSDDGHGAVLEWKLNVAETQGKLSGSINGELVTMPLIDPKFDGTRLTFGAFVNPDCTIQFKLDIDSKKLKGEFSGPEVNDILTVTKQS